MPRLTLLCAAVILMSMCIHPAKADSDWELSFNTGYTSHLITDSSGHEDSPSGARYTMRFYPLSQLQVSAVTEGTYYSSFNTLSNWHGRTGFVWIPTSAESNLSIYLEGNFDARRYRKPISAFDTNEPATKLSAGYRLNPNVQLRSGVKFASTTYVRPDTVSDPDYQQGEVFAGINLTLFGSNTLDIEGGIGITRYSSIDASIDSVFPTNPFNPGEQESATHFVHEGDFSAFYISPRLSRSIGQKTGMSLTYTWRHFSDVENSVVIGYANEFLSPWTSFYDGSSIQARLKTLLVPHMIITAGYGYWAKSYLKTTDQGIVSIWQYQDQDGVDWYADYLLWTDPKNAETRTDFTNRFFVGVQRPFRFGDGLLVEASLNFQYSDNHSTRERFEYNTTEVTAGVVIRP